MALFLFSPALSLFSLVNDKENEKITRLQQESFGLHLLTATIKD